MYTIFEVVALCLKHDVDFEVWNANTDNSQRSAMLINLTPAVRVDFGDKGHGQQISRIHLADNHRLAVNAEALMESIKGNNVDARWNAGTTRDPAMFRSVGGGRVSVMGKVTDLTFYSMGDTIIQWIDLEIVNSVRNLLTGQVTDMEPTTIRLFSEISDEATTERHKRDIPVGFYMYAEGHYKYPNIIEVTTAGPIPQV